MLDSRAEGIGTCPVENCRGCFTPSWSAHDNSSTNKSPRTVGIAIQSRVCVRKIEGVDMWLVQKWQSPSVSLSSPKGAPREPQ